jgi:hypothetical protein
MQLAFCCPIIRENVTTLSFGSDEGALVNLRISLGAGGGRPFGGGNLLIGLGTQSWNMFGTVVE